MWAKGENNGNPKSQGTRNSDWRTLKLKGEVFEGFEEIKRSLKAKHGKPVSNSDAMKFLLYLAKVALELEGNPKLEGVAEPLVYDKLAKLEAYSRSVADYLGIPAEYVRGGVLWGLLDIAGESLKTSWREGEYYLRLADAWFAGYSVHVFEDEVAMALEKILYGIYWVGQNNPRRGEIRGRLFENVENLVSRLFSSPNLVVVRALLKGEVYSGHVERATGVLRRVLRYESSQNTDQIRGIIAEFLGTVYGRVNPGEFTSIVEALTRGSASLSQELFIIETASEFIDVGQFYDKILKRRYLLPYDRIEIAKSMIRTASKKEDEALLSRAIEVAKAELEKLRKGSTLDWKNVRWSLAMTLLESGFEDKILALKFPDEIPTVQYHLLMSLSKLMEDFERGWGEFKRLLSMVYSVRTREECHFLDSFELFVPVEFSEVECCLNPSEYDNPDFGRLRVSLLGSKGRGTYVTGILIETDDGVILYQGHLDTGEQKLLRELFAPLVRALLKEGVTIESDIDKILAAELLKDLDKDLARALLVEVLGSKASLHILKDVGVIKLLDEVCLNPVDALRMVLGNFSLDKPSMTYDLELLAVNFVKALAFVKKPEKLDGVLELIETGPLLEVMAERLKMDGPLPHVDFNEIRDRLVDSFIEGVAEKHGYTLASELVMRHKLSTSLVPWLIQGLLKEGKITKADKLASEFGLGWLGKGDLVTLIEYRFEKCVSLMMELAGILDERGLEWWKVVKSTLARTIEQKGYVKLNEIEAVLGNNSKEVSSEELERFFKLFFDGGDLQGRRVYVLKQKWKELLESDCHKSTLLLLRNSKKFLDEAEYTHIGGKFGGRFLAWLSIME